MPETLATFRGPVSCTRAAHAPELTLSGITAQRPDEPAALAFSGAVPADFPATLADAVVESLSGGQYRITSAGRSWLLSAAAVHLHFEIAAQFYRAIPPRRVPWMKRVLWRALLILAGSRAGVAVLRALRR
jgi:hypothetical protein